MSSIFKRKREDFVCAKCGMRVQGNGYTNHCPKCLWSKHVDVHPGDRDETCGGLMEPVSVTESAGQYSIMHKCVLCRIQKKNKSQTADNFSRLIELS